MNESFLKEKQQFIEKLTTELTQLTETLSSAKFSACEGSDPCDRSTAETAVADNALKRKARWERLQVLTRLLPALEEWNGICPCCKNTPVYLSQVDSTSSLMCTDCRIELVKKNKLAKKDVGVDA